MSFLLLQIPHPHLPFGPPTVELVEKVPTGAFRGRQPSPQGGEMPRPAPFLPTQSLGQHLERAPGPAFRNHSLSPREPPWVAPALSSEVPSHIPPTECPGPDGLGSGHRAQLRRRPPWVACGLLAGPLHPVAAPLPSMATTKPPAVSSRVPACWRLKKPERGRGGLGSASGRWGVWSWQHVGVVGFGVRSRAGCRGNHLWRSHPPWPGRGGDPVPTSEAVPGEEMLAPRLGKLRPGG